MKYVCLRDDDTSFITTPEQLKTCYGEFWGEIPVTLATIPFLHGSSEKINEFGYAVPNSIKQMQMREWQKNATAEEIKGFHSFQPIGDNVELVNELKRLVSLGKVEIAQHGVFHRYNECGAEMQKSQMSFEWVRDGKEYLEKVFGIKVATFIPPANTIDRTTIGYLKSLELNVFSSGSLLHHSKLDLVLSYLSDPISAKDKMLSLVGRPEAPLKRRCNTLIFSSITYDAFKNQKDIYDRIMENLRRTGFAGLGTHYQLLLRDAEYRKLYHELLHKLSGNQEIKFVTAAEYRSLLFAKYYGN